MVGGSTHCQTMCTYLTAQILCNEARRVSSVHTCHLRKKKKKKKKESRCIGESIFSPTPSYTVPLVHLLQHLHLVGLKDGHGVESRACLSRHCVGLTDQSGIGPTSLELEAAINKISSNPKEMASRASGRWRERK